MAIHSVTRTNLATRSNSVTTEYLGKLVDRHNEGASESDIRIAFRDFLLQTGVASDESEISVPRRALPRTAGIKVDLYIRNTYVEFKKDRNHWQGPSPPGTSASSTGTSLRTLWLATESKTVS